MRMMYYSVMTQAYSGVILFLTGLMIIGGKFEQHQSDISRDILDFVAVETHSTDTRILRTVSFVPT